MKYASIFFFVAMMTANVKGQIAAWQLNGATGSETCINASTIDVHLNTPALSRGSGLTASALANAFGSKSFSSSGTRADAIASNDYIQVSLNAKAGYIVSLSTLNVKFRRSSTGPNSFRWRYSIDGSTFIDIGSADISYTLTTSNGDAQDQLDLSRVTSLQNVPSSRTIIIRLLGWGASSTSGTFAIGKSTTTGTTDYSLAIGGTVTSDVSLPVTMKGITAKVEAGKVYLNIATATEIDIAGFNITRSFSQDGPFELISGYASNAALKTSGSSTSGGSYSFVDAKVDGGKTYYYKVESVSTAGVSKQAGEILEVQVTVPKEYEVYQNYPNPFNPATMIRFDLKESANVTLEFYNVLGMKVKSLSNATMAAGTHETQVDMSRMPSGVYYCRFIAVDNTGKAFVQTMRMMMMK